MDALGSHSPGAEEMQTRGSEEMLSRLFLMSFIKEFFNRLHTYEYTAFLLEESHGSWAVHYCAVPIAWIYTGVYS
jgi:hypothetical protein